VNPFMLDDGVREGDLVLHLHGGFSESSVLHGLLAPRLGDRYRVVGFDRRGHGKTPDTDEPFHYSTMADEAVDVLRGLDAGPAYVVGYSDGGGVALWLAHRHPDLVRSMVLIGAGFHHRALRDDWIDESDPQYAAMFDTPYAVKAKAMYTTEPTFTVDDLHAMTMPVLLVFGDDDCFDLSHSVEMYEALPNAQLAVVPGASHLVGVEKPALLLTLIDDFLTSGGVVRTILPVRRR
jgi:pimeloyl-ACP methyl ester carboxylesterase